MWQLFGIALWILICQALLFRTTLDAIQATIVLKREEREEKRVREGEGEGEGGGKRERPREGSKALIDRGL